MLVSQYSASNIAKVKTSYMPACKTIMSAFVEQITQDTEKLQNHLVTANVQILLVVCVAALGEFLFIKRVSTYLLLSIVVKS